MPHETTPAGKLSHWFAGLFFVIVALAGFAFASHAKGEEIHYILGLIAGGAGLFGLFWLLKRGFDTH